MEQSPIVVENLTKSFELKRTKSVFGNLVDISKGRAKLKPILALDKISFEIHKGEMVGIIGRNGSGKTTLLRMISGVYTPDRGSVKVNGRMAPLLQIGTGFHPELDAQENIIMYGMLLGMTKKEIKQKVDSIVEFADLTNFSEMKLKHYSNGMRARLGFSIALQVNPDILLVDEILSVGDEVFRKKSFDAFLNFKKNKKTILYATHNLSNLQELCDRVLLIHQGKQVMIGKAEEVIKKYQEINK